MQLQFLDLNQELPSEPTVAEPKRVRRLPEWLLSPAVIGPLSYPIWLLMIHFDLRRGGYGRLSAPQTIFSWQSSAKGALLFSAAAALAAAIEN